MITNKSELFHLKNLAPSNRTSGFEIDNELLISKNGYDSYVCNHEPNKDPQVVYKLNEKGFRSENFEPLTSKNLNVLISGCSVTFGQGVFQEHSWPELFSKEIGLKSNKPIKMYNLAVMGGSVHLTIKNLMSFIRTYGSPDEIYLLLPPSSRRLVYDEHADNFRNILVNKEGYKSLANKKNLAVKRFYDSYCEEDTALLATTLMGLFESFCEAKNIKLVWSSYGTISKSDFYKSSGFKFYKQYRAPGSEFYASDKTSLHLVPENKNNIPHWMTGSDGDHPGAAWHYEISKMFLDFSREAF
jgi:hypothetical protein